MVSSSGRALRTTFLAVGLGCTVLGSTWLVAQPHLLAVAGRGGGSHVPGQGYLGVDLRDVSLDPAAGQRARDVRGAEIVRVDHDGPAGKAGLREHDLILSVNSTSVESEQQLRKLLREMQPGRSVSLLVSRDGVQQTINTTLGDREEVARRAWEQHWVVPEPQDATLAESVVPRELPSTPPRGFAHGFVSGHLLPGPAYTGLTVDAIGPQLADFFGMKDGRGLLVHAVDANSPAANAGLHAGDVITHVNGKVMGTRADWTRAVHDSKGHSVSVTVMREHREQTFVVVPDGKHRSCLEQPGTERHSLLAMLFPWQSRP